MTARLAGCLLLVAPLAAQIPSVVAEHGRQGVTAREAGRLEEARRELEAAVRAAPELAEAHLYLGLVLHENEQYAAAADALSKALGLKPQLPRARELLGFDLLMLGRAAEAVPHLDAARREDSGRWELSAWLGRAYLESGDPEMALPHLLDAQAQAARDPQLLYLTAKAYSQLAVREQARLLALAPESEYAHLAAAEDHDLNGRPDDAIAAYRRALAVSGALPGAWRALGDLEQGRGRHPFSRTTLPCICGTARHCLLSGSPPKRCPT
ncbi:MAG: tetratricopeptide repeat protein [Bryobacterales bacterium]|nr:tetratricopeptide repeat protein [Bryobacterales bacterium]